MKDATVQSAGIRDTLVRLNSFSRSAFGVNVRVIHAPDEPGFCSCAQLADNETEPEECAEFHRTLFSRTDRQQSVCPAGLTVLSQTLHLPENSQALLKTDSFLIKGQGKSSPGKEKNPAGTLGEAQTNGAPHLDPEHTDLLSQFLDVAALSVSSARDSQIKAAVAAAQEEFWQTHRGGISLVGLSPGITKIRDTLTTFANSSEPVLIESEQGNGRHLVASLLHRLSPRTDRPFVCENVSLLHEAIQETELFGPKGDGKQGLLKYAAGGTIYLEHVENLSVSAQRKLLHFMDTGSTKETRSRKAGQPAVRIITSSSRNIAGLVRKGRFRNDLQRRLRRLTLFIPPLRERAEDLPLLVEHFLKRRNGGNGHESRRVEVETLALLQKYSWPGNVGELESELAAAAALGHPTIELEDFAIHIQNAVRPPRASLSNLKEAVGNLEVEIISRTLGETRWNKSQAARVLGLSRLGLQKKIDRYSLDRRR